MQIQRLRTKTAEALAVQWDGTINMIPELINMVLVNGGVATLQCTTSPCSGIASGHSLTIHTATGIKPVDPTDWIFRGPEGDFYVVTDEDREKKFEVVT